MARDYTGSNQSDGLENGVSNIDLTLMTYSCLVSPDATGTDTFLNSSTDFTAGNSVLRIRIRDAAGSAEFEVVAAWSTQVGIWGTDNAFAVGTAYYVCTVTYDNTSVSNDPIIYIDGTVEANTEDATPSGTVASGADSIRVGENHSGGQDFNGQVAEIGIWNRILSAAEIAGLGKHYAPSFYPRGRVAYWSLIRSLNDRTGAGNLAAVNGSPTTVAHPRMIYPQPVGAQPVAAAVAAPTLRVHALLGVGV